MAIRAPDGANKHCKNCRENNNPVQKLAKIGIQYSKLQQKLLGGDQLLTLKDHFRKKDVWLNDFRIFSQAHKEDRMNHNDESF